MGAILARRKGREKEGKEGKEEGGSSLYSCHCEERKRGRRTLHLAGKKRGVKKGGRRGGVGKKSF